MESLNVFLTRIGTMNRTFSLTTADEISLPPRERAGVRGNKASEYQNFPPQPTVHRERFMESLHVFFDAHCNHEPVPLSNDGPQDPPLPKGEGWGEGELGVRITNRFGPNQRFMERRHVSFFARGRKERSGVFSSSRRSGET
jgi:hypothetical protein